MSRFRLRGDRGVSTIEVVLLTPLFLTFTLFIVAFGLVVDAQGQVNGVARDAARAGSLKRSSDRADQVAGEMARSQLLGKCTEIQVGHPVHDFRPGGMYSIRIDCTVSLNAFSLIGIGSVTVHGQSVAPLDQFRRVS
jgi:hypothetical protein